MIDEELAASIEKRKRMSLKTYEKVMKMCRRLKRINMYYDKVKNSL